MANQASACDVGLGPVHVYRNSRQHQCRISKAKTRDLEHGVRTQQRCHHCRGGGRVITEVLFFCRHLVLYPISGEQGDDTQVSVSVCQSCYAPSTVTFRFGRASFRRVNHPISFG